MILAILYLFGAVISYFFFHKHVLKKICKLHNKRDMHNHMFCYLYGAFWLLGILFSAVYYIYDAPARIVKNVEKRREYYKK